MVCRCRGLYRRRAKGKRRPLEPRDTFGSSAGQHFTCFEARRTRRRTRYRGPRGGDEQVIGRSFGHRVRPAPAIALAGSERSGDSSLMPGIVACTQCQARFAEGVKFCGRCGNRSFVLVSPGDAPSGFPCPRCSNMLAEGSRFCGRCGLSISQTSATSPLRTVGIAAMPQPSLRACRNCGSASARDPFAESAAEAWPEPAFPRFHDLRTFPSICRKFCFRGKLRIITQLRRLCLHSGRKE